MAQGKEASDLGDVLDFMRVLWAVDHALEAASKRMESELGVTGPQRLVIRIVGRYPRISAGELADILHLHPSTLTGVLRRLEHRSIVSRSTDPGDARRALFSLTARGKKLDSRRLGTVEAAVRRALSRIPKRKIAETAAVLAALTDGLSATKS